MPQAFLRGYHALDADVHHVLDERPIGQEMPPEDRLRGTGGKARCLKCQAILEDRADNRPGFGR